ncbi:hypothetical protein C8J57DRAFT_1233001 [Mycena rebaudengoi]|nr:hypothetical protein C8J57DRAFT_1233001 [Mycena rebaudengoi]
MCSAVKNERDRIRIYATKADRKLVAASSHITDRRLGLVEVYSSSLPLPGFREPANLSGIEGNMEHQIEQLCGCFSEIPPFIHLTIRGGTTNDVAEIVFITTSLLGFSGPDLFEKLFVVVPQSPIQDLEGRWSDLVNEGMHILRLESQPEVLLPQILDGSHSTDRDMLPVNVHEVYAQAAAIMKRDQRQAVILLVGPSGHGKSETINCLIDQALLRIGESTLGLTTKAIQRVRVSGTRSTTSTTATVVFDDTPPLEDTTYLDRKTNAAIMHRYKETYFQNIFPNAILLVASWDSIMPDAHNKVSHFISSVGRSMYYLFLSGLVDGDRTNVLVVITKSLSSMDQFEDFETKHEKDAHWRLEAGRRNGIITDLQRKRYERTLPNLARRKEKNLFDAIRDMMECKSPGSQQCCDLVGIQALQALIAPSSRVEVENLVEQSPEEIADQETTDTEPLEERIRQLTGPEQIASRPPTSPCAAKSNYKPITPVVGPTSPQFQQIRNNIACTIFIQIAAIDPDRVELSAEMRSMISRLPPFSALSEKEYMQFFADYGTHIVTRLALGGVLWIILDSRDEAFNQKASATGNGANTRIGGGSVAPEITSSLERNFIPDIKSPEWQEVRRKWIKDLEKDPVFCPDHPLAEYQPLYTVCGLPWLEQKRLHREKGAEISESAKEQKPLRRRKNWFMVARLLRGCVTQAVWKIGGNRLFPMSGFCQKNPNPELDLRSNLPNPEPNIGQVHKAGSSYEEVGA